MNEEQIIDAISLARAQNNKNWMEILRIALKSSPEETRKVLTRIRTQDKKIMELLDALSNNDDGDSGTEDRG